MSATIVCPSGLSGEIRGLKGKEGKLFAERSLARSGALFDTILQGCWLRTLDPGVYDVAADGPLDWDRVLVADRFHTLVRIRALTFGEEYSFAAQCTAAACRERFEWSIRLNELPVRELAPESRTAFRTGNRLETRLGDGRRLWFRLMTGADEKRAALVLKGGGREGLLLTALAFRIVEIEGVAERDRRRFLEEMEMADAAALLDRFDAADGGVETAIEVECPHCLGIQEVQLPFERGFFLPRTRTPRTGQQA